MSNPTAESQAEAEAEPSESQTSQDAAVHRDSLNNDSLNDDRVNDESSGVSKGFFAAIALVVVLVVGLLTLGGGDGGSGTLAAQVQGVQPLILNPQLPELPADKAVEAPANGPRPQYLVFGDPQAPNPFEDTDLVVQVWPASQAEPAEAVLPARAGDVVVPQTVAWFDPDAQLQYRATSWSLTQTELDRLAAKTSVLNGQLQVAVVPDGLTQLGRAQWLASAHFAGSPLPAPSSLMAYGTASGSLIQAQDPSLEILTYPGDFAAEAAALAWHSTKFTTVSFRGRGAAHATVQLRSGDIDMPVSVLLWEENAGEIGVALSYGPQILDMSNPQNRLLLENNLASPTDTVWEQMLNES